MMMRAVKSDGAQPPRKTSGEVGGKGNKMKRSHIVRALLAGSAILLSSGAWGQEPEAQPDASDATADATIAETQSLDDTIESPRESWRLQLLREWSHEQVEEVFA